MMGQDLRENTLNGKETWVSDEDFLRKPIH